MDAIVISAKGPAHNYSAIIDRHFTVTCPHCGVPSGLSAVSIPQVELVRRYQPPRLGVGYVCDACKQPVFLRFSVKYDWPNLRFFLLEPVEEVERARESYEFHYLPTAVADDFREALTCYAASCLNAFSAMCRRTVQTACQELGAAGSDKVLAQLRDLHEMAQVDQETFDLLKTVIISGHDGAHPHLPSLSPARAEILRELMKDVLYQLFVRRQKIQEAAERRREAVEKGREQ
jgi:hypothetical protein